MMRICALALLLAAAAHAEKSEWSQPIKEADSRSDWIPFRPPRDLDVSAQEEVSTILRPPSNPAFVRQTRLIQSPRQERQNFGPPPQQPYFPGDQSHLVRFPGQGAIPLRGAASNGPPPQFIPNFRPPPQQQFQQQAPQPSQQFFNQAPPQQFVNQQPPQKFAGQQPNILRPQNQSFVPAGPQDEVQLVYVPVEALPPFQKPSNNVPVRTKAPPQIPATGQFGRLPQGPVLPLGNQQQQFEQDQQRIARLKEQEERQRIQEQELLERQAQEKRIRQEAEEKQRLQQQQFRPPQNFAAPKPNLKAQENIFQQKFPQTTELPTNPAPHQPPLAVYLTAGRPQTKLTVEDVIASLKDASTIPVLDTLPDTKNPPPQIFVGPAEMNAPNGYSKFDLPYLNSLDTNRVERKVEQLPFFVAPLSYNPPQGYNKIPFPSPHVGSVVVAPGARHFNTRPASPDPEEQYNPNDGSQISPAIPLLVNSLQAGPQTRPKFQQPQQQQFVAPPPAQRFQEPQQQQFAAPPPPPTVQRFQPPQQQQFVSPPPPAPVQRFQEPQQQQFEAPSPPPTVQRFRPPPPPPQIAQQLPPQFIYQDEQSFGPPAPPAQPAFVRQHHRQHHHQQNNLPQVEQYIRQEVTPAHQFTPPQQPQYIEETVPAQPEFIRNNNNNNNNNQFQYTEEPQQEVQQFENEVPTEPPTTTAAPTTTPIPPRQANRVRTRPPVASTTAAPRTRAPARNYDETTERRPVNRGRRPVQRQRTTTPVPEVEEQAEEQYLDVPRENTVQQQDIQQPTYHLPSSQLSPFTNQQHFAQIPTRSQQFDAKPQFPAFQGQFEHSFRSLPSPTPQIGVTYINNGAPENHRAVFDDQSQGVSPSTINYPTPSPGLEPHVSLKGEIGQVQHSPSPSPFAPTSLPEHFTPQTLTASPSFAPVAAETEAPTTPPAEIVPEITSTEEPQRTRQRIPAAENVAVNSTPRPRARVNGDGQRFRARPTATREEGQDETVPHHNAQRPRGRQVVRVRTTTEPAVAEQGENVAADAPRNRNRFRAIDRTREGPRQQQVVRTRRPIVQQQEDIELAKPVRTGPSTERTISDSPIFLAETEAEAEISTERSTTEAATTQKPGRRFNNFGVGQRTRRIRPVANQEQTENAATTVAPSRSFTTARPSIRRQTTTAPIGRSTLRGGARLRRPIGTTEAPVVEEAASAAVETGVTYSKNPHVSIQHNDKPEEAVAEEAAPVVPLKITPLRSTHVEQFHKQSVTPAHQRENYPENYEVDDGQSDTVVYRPRVRKPNKNRYHQQEDPEFNVEESQRSELISVQQLDDAVSILKNYYNTKYEDVPSEVEEIIDFTEEPSTEPALVADEAAEQSTDPKVEFSSTDPVPTTIAEEVSEVVTSPTEEPKIEKFSAKIKVSEPKRRIRIKKRPVGDVFETAESQNIASAKNTYKTSEKVEKKISSESKYSVAEEKGQKNEESSEHKDVVQISFTTTSTTTTTEAPSEVAETVTAKSATDSTQPIPDEMTTFESTTPSSAEEEFTTEPFPRIIGTSTTTEISLETEICYKGRCIKRKVDADQVPIE